MVSSPIWNFLDIAVVQSYILQKRDTGNANLNLKTFKMSVAMSLMKQGKSTRVKGGRPSFTIEKAYESKNARRPTAPIPHVSIRTDHYDHFPVYFDKQGRCRKPDCQGNLLSVHLFSFGNVILGYASQDLPIVLKNSMIRKHFFDIYQWLYWWTIMMADNLEPYIILYRTLFLCIF